MQRFLEALATEQPSLLVLEDLQWADGSLLDLIESLFASLTGVPLMLLGLARPEFLESRAGWVSLPANLTVHLEALHEAQSRELVLQLLSGRPADPDLASRVEQAAGGNSLFIEELAAWLSESGSDEVGGLPTNVKAMIAARLDRLPPADRQVLLNASVIGDVFWQGALEALGGDGSLSEVLRSLERRDLVRRVQASRIEGDRELAFKHTLIREVAYSTLPKATRRERHAAVAGFIEDAAGDRAAYAGILAHHWREAGATAKAADYLLTAADQAGRGWAQREAVELCNQALELIPDGDEVRRRRARLRRAVALMAQLHGGLDLPPGDQSKSSGEMSPPIS